MSSKKFRYFISKYFQGKFPRLYSTLDNPIEVPVQVAAYKLAIDRYISEKDKVLDVGFGLGYGIKYIAAKARHVTGIDIDKKAVKKAQNELTNNNIIIKYYDGYTFPFPNGAFDVVTCIDVIEHVSDYMNLLINLCNVAKYTVVLSTPNRRPESTNKDGTPKNIWHIREWSFEELNTIISKLNIKIEWNFINGPWKGPFLISQYINESTLALTPALLLNKNTI